MPVAFSLKTLAVDSGVSLAWMIVAPSVSRFGRVGSALSMINYYAIAWRTFECKALGSGQGTHDVFPTNAIFFSLVSSKVVLANMSLDLTVNAKVCGGRGSGLSIL